jgi:O-antigen/teichoic acid export membrane protein
MTQNLSNAANAVATTEQSDDRYFKTERLKTGLGARTARGGAVTFASQGFRFFTSLGATMVLGRLLTPADYGLIGMVVVVTGFVSMFKDLGLSAATVQREEITSEQVSTLFWVNVALSIGVGMVTAALAPAVAWFYGEPKLTAIVIVYAVGFLFGGLTVQHEALLHRQMRFVAQSSCDIIALLATITVTILLAWRGAGYWALVGGHLTTSFVYMVGIWTVCRWRPGPPARGSGVRSLLRFGGNLTGFGVVNFFARNLDNMLIGRVWGSTQLGLYAKAYQLLTLPIDQINSPITTVAVPALSRLNDSPERYRRAYLRIIEKIAVVTMPGIALLIATSDWVVLVILGPQWTEASHIFAALAVAALIQPIANTTGWLFISQNRTDDMFRYGLVASTIIVAAIVIGLPWGAVGVAAVYALVWVTIVTPMLFYWVGRRGPVRPLDFYRTVAPAFCAAFAVLAALFLFRRSVVIVSPVKGLAASFGIACAVTLLSLYAAPAGRRVLRDFAEVAAIVLRKNRTDFGASGSVSTHAETRGQSEEVI